MKPFLLLLFSIPAFCFAQNDSIIEYSKLAKMMMQPGAFVKLQYDTLGTTDDLHIGLMTATSLKDGTTERSICFVNNSLLRNSILFDENNIQIPVEDLATFIDALELMGKETEIKTERGLEKYQYVSSNFTVLKLENRSFNTKRWNLLLYARYSNINAPVRGMFLNIRADNISGMLAILQKFRKEVGDDLLKKL